MMKLDLPLFTGNAFDGIHLHNFFKQDSSFTLVLVHVVGLHLTQIQNANSLDV